MLKEAKPDCVYIAATCDAHYELSKLCLEHGVPVLCEKAMFFKQCAGGRNLCNFGKKRDFCDGSHVEPLPPGSEAGKGMDPSGKDRKACSGAD